MNMSIQSERGAAKQTLLKHVESARRDRGNRGL